MVEISDPKRKSGIGVLGDAPWGTHFCQFYKTMQDQTDILVPYFKAGLENNEFCMWVTAEPLSDEEARAALRKAVKDLDGYIEKGQIEIVDFSRWHTRAGKFDADSVLQGWVDKERQALKNGFEGLRLAGNTFWLENKDWKSFSDYEAAVENFIHDYKMLAICSYSLDKCGANEILDVFSTHQFALINRDGKWIVIESADRKRAEEALRESEEKYRNLVESIIDVIYTIDGDGAITYISPIIKNVLGYEPDELIGRHFMEFVYEEDRSALRQRFADLGKGIIKPAEYRMIDKQGDITWVRTLTNPIVKGKGFAGGQGTLIDVTERKRAEEASKRAEEEVRQKAKDLQEKNDELIRFTTAVLHDLRSPLITIQTFHGYLGQDIRSQDAARIEKDLAYIRNSADRIGRLTDELLRLSRVGRVVNPSEDAPLRAIVEEALDLVAGRIAERGVRVEITEEPVVLWGDRTRLVEVFQNLVDNAVKFMGDEPAPRLEIGVEQAGEEMVIYVRDNGIGIDPRVQPVLFGLFQKLDPETEGMGIGLALVRRIVELHGGRIWVKSEGLGKGATFRFTLAKTRRERAEEGPPDPPEGAG